MVVTAAQIKSPTQFRENFRIGRRGTLANARLVVKWGSCTFQPVKYLFALFFLTLCGVEARGREAAEAPSNVGDNTPAAAKPVTEAEITGRVLERGSLTALAGAHVVTQSGEAFTDSDGHFTLRVTSGTVELSITADGYEHLVERETLAPGEGLRVEYRLLRLPAYRQRYVSTVRGEARHEGERFVLSGSELHQTAGTLGDPLRVVGLLPGVSMPLTLLPVYVIRGASPGTNGFFLDGMRVPQVYHFVVGGGVVHPELIDRLDFYPGAYDVSFGHYAGGVIDVETRPARADAPAHGQAELRLYEVSALAEARLPGGVRVEAGGHYGFPSYLVHLFDKRADLSYWDFQLRADWKTLTLEVLGSYDYLTLQTDPGRPAVNGKPAVPPTIADNALQFYRVQLRDRHRIGRVATEAALVGGFDDLLALGPSITKLSLAWRANVQAAWPRFRLYAGLDGELSRFRASDFSTDTAADQPDALGELAGDRDGVESGAFVEGTLEILRQRLWATAGVRADVYHAGKVTLLGVDPRLQLRARLMPQLSVEAGIGLYQQPPSFPIALPGVDTFALQLGLQRAIQAAYTVEATLPAHTVFKITGYWQQYYNVNDAVLDLSIAVCTSPPPESLTGFPARITRQVDGESYGMELLARKQQGRFTGWISYTLSRSERRFSCGLRPADYDQTHVLNVVTQVRLPWNLMAGARLLVQTGRPVTILEPPDGRTTVRNNSRLPTYVQLDLRLDREWIFPRWALSAFVEVLNLTYSESVIGLAYPVDPDTGITRFDMPRLNGFTWILPTVGLRGRF